MPETSILTNGGFLTEIISNSRISKLYLYNKAGPEKVHREKEKSGNFPAFYPLVLLG